MAALRPGILGHRARYPFAVRRSGGGCALALAALLAASVSTGVIAQPAPLPPADAVQLLTRIQQAARTLDYSGVLAHQQGSRIQASRIVHVIDATGERERIEALDGAPREFLRHNGEVECLLPERQMVLRETHRGERFPGLLMAGVTGNLARAAERLTDYYQISVHPAMQRLAGRRCREVTITPRDALRYGYRLCVDASTQLLLQAQTLASAQQATAADAVVEQIAFTALQLGRDTEVALLASAWPKHQWQVYEHDFKPADLAAHGWRLRPPPGFVTVAQLRRRGWNHDATDDADHHNMLQLLLSDGLAAISVFIEPVRPDDDPAHGSLPVPPPAPHLQGAARQGATNAWGARIANHWLIGLGEVPMATLKSLIESTQYTPPPGSQ